MCPYNYLTVEQLYNVHGHMIFPILGVKILYSSLVSCTVVKSGIATEDQEWFFFTEQSLKHQNDNPKKRKRGQKQELVNRQTKTGFWKSTGKDREIESGGIVVGMKKSLVFHRGSTKGKGKGIGTSWVMHEYSTTQKEFDGKHPGQVGFCYSVCLIDVKLTSDFLLITQLSVCVDLRLFCLQNHWR